MEELFTIAVFIDFGQKKLVIEKKLASMSPVKKQTMS